jgi:uncharacterized protein YecT (DUF1311 family)
MGRAIGGCVVIVLLMVPAASAASPPPVPGTSTSPPPVSYDRSCERAHHFWQSQTGMNECASDELHQLEAEMATNLKRVENLPIAPSAMVRQAQRQFLRYRATECDAAARPVKGGTISPWVRLRCEIGLTVQRIQQLREDDRWFAPH